MQQVAAVALLAHLVRGRGRVRVMIRARGRGRGSYP